MAVEREIRFVVSAGEPPAGGRRQVQAYFLRGPATARVRTEDGRRPRLTFKLPRREGRFEWECAVPAALARLLLALPLPRVEKTRRLEGDLEVDVYAWPRALVVVECELSFDVDLDLRDAAGRAAWMEARRPGWVRAWHDVTDDHGFTAARLARRKRPPAAP